jgi:hypothetical protein
MSSDIKNTGPQNLLNLSAVGAPKFSLGAPLATPADTSLSAAFRHVLGQGPSESPFQNSGLKIGQEIAKRGKPERPGAQLSTAPRRNQIGPRSGHK